MVERELEKQTSPSPNGGFLTTSWSLVVAAGRGSDPGSQRALETLCSTYWQPLYFYIRRRGYGVEDAEDLIQGFFTRFLEKNYFARADRERGRFRSFLLASLKNFIKDEWAKGRVQKRGGGQVVLSLDLESAESGYKLEPSTRLTPDILYERRWILAILDAVLAQMRSEYEAAGKAAHFDTLKGFLTLDGTRAPYRKVALELGISEGAVKVAVHRLRRRYRNLARAAIATTVTESGQLDEEIRHLISIFDPRKS